jgi:hypothetical protein
MCEPTTWLAIGSAAAGLYGADRASSAASKGRQQQEEQMRMAQEMEAQRLAQERAIAEEAFRAQQAAQHAQMRAFSEQQAAARRAAEEAKRAEVRRQRNIQDGQGIIEEMFGQFNDDFYGQRRQSYVDFATPQLDRQYQEAMNSLVRSLSRSGNLNSSVRAQSMSDLQRQYQEALGTIGSQGAQYANQQRANIEAQRADLIQRNASLADPGVMRGLVESSVGSLSNAPTYTPIGTLINALMTNSQQPAGVNRQTPNNGANVGLVSNSLAPNTGATIQ